MKFNICQFLFLFFWFFFIAEFSHLVDCSHLKFLKNVSHNNTILKCSLDISDLNAKLAFDSGANFLLKNPNYDFGVCKYLHDKNNLLIRFNKKDPLDHINLYLCHFQNMVVNLQTSHHNIENSFNLFSNEDFFGKKKDQLISNEIRIYSKNHQLFFNSNHLLFNKVLGSFQNAEEFNVDLKKSITVQNYCDSNKSKFFKKFKSSFNI